MIDGRPPISWRDKGWGRWLYLLHLGGLLGSAKARGTPSSFYGRIAVTNGLVRTILQLSRAPCTNSATKTCMRYVDGTAVDSCEGGNRKRGVADDNLLFFFAESCQTQRMERPPTRVKRAAWSNNTVQLIPPRASHTSSSPDWRWPGWVTVRGEERGGGHVTPHTGWDCVCR